MTAVDARPDGPLARRLSALARGAAPGEVGEVGEKARSLVDLARRGLPVPDGLCITTRAFAAATAARGIRELAERARVERSPEAARRARDAIACCEVPAALAEELAAFHREEAPGAFAVRSSGSCEDLAGASFAGLYRTVLGPRTVPELLDAVRACWSSAFEPSVLGYCADRGLDTRDLSLGVLVQRLVPAEKSGVLFSVDPVLGRDTVMLIEAAFGLGETLVSGAVSPDRYRYDWYRDEEVERAVARKRVARFAGDPEPRALGPEQCVAPVLEAGEVRELVELGLRVQEDTGHPVDLEWAIADGEIALLQSRPITRIGFGGIEGEWTTADFRDGGVSSDVCTPFMASLYRSVFETSLPRYFDGLGLRGAPGTPWLRSFFARPYWNLGAAKQRMRQLPGHTDASFEEGLGIRPHAGTSSEPTRLTPRSLWTGLRAARALRRSCRAQLRRCPGFAAAQRRRLQELDAIDPDALPRDELLRVYEAFLRRDYTRSESTYFTLIYDNSNLTTQFREAFLKTGSEIAYPLLLGGLSDVSHLEPSLALWDVSRAIRARPDWRSFWLERQVPDVVEAWRRGARDRGLDQLARLVEAFRHHSARELDPTVPRFDEDPSLLAEALKAAVALGDAGDPRRQGRRQQAASAAARERFLAELPWRARRRMARRLDQVRRFLWWREELRDLSTRFYYHVRRLTLAVGRELARAGALQRPEDVFFLPVDEVLDAGAGRIDAARLAARVRANRRYYRSFRRYEIPSEIGLAPSGEPEPAGGGARVLTGVACSAGVARGRARVVADIFDADRIERGDILITRCTDPGWTPKFGLLAGVATETGGLLSHAAVIAREYGIPAVLAVAGVTRRVRDGDVVLLDGTAGAVTVEPAR